MPVLATCIRKAGKALDASDAAAIREIYQDYVDAGSENAAQAAISDYLNILERERQDAIDAAEAAGGDVSSLRGNLLYAKTDRNTGIAESLSAVRMLYGEEELPGLPKKPSVRGLADALTKRARKLNRGKAFNARTDRNKDILAEALAIEVEAAMDQTGHAGHWYSNSMRDALAIAGLIHPEIETDPHAKTAFIAAMAITSNGASMQENTEYAEKAYAGYKKKGSFPVVGQGPEAENIKKAFALFNALKDAWGMDQLSRFLNTEFTVAELKLIGLKVNGENMDTTVFGSAIFGPKVGQGFFQNLAGNFHPLTMDRWWMRTWGRLVGNLAAEGLKAAQAQADTFLSILDDNAAKVQELGFSVDEVQQSDKQLMALARKATRRFAKGRFKDRSEFNRAAKNLYSAATDPVVAPRNGTERAWIREVVAEAQDRLRARGRDVDTATMQALLWYPEKDLYRKMGVGNERSKPTDFAREFEKLATGRGVDKQRIAAAIAAGRERRIATAVGAPGEAAAPEGRGISLAEKARRELIQKAAARAVREAGKSSFSGRAPRRNERTVAGAPVSRTHAIQRFTKNRFARAGLAVPDFYELTRSQASAKSYKARLDAARKTMNAVTGEYTLEDLEDMRLFLAEDGAAGFALNAGEIVALFKDPKAADLPGISQAALRLAVEQGGRTIQALDNYAPHLFALQGFKAVARTSWPEGTKPLADQKKFNNGKPDTLFMVYDKNNFEPYGAEGVHVESVDAAMELQDAARNALEPRNTPRRALRYRLEDDADPDRAPESPLSRISKLAATVEDQIEGGPGDGRTLREMAADLALGKSAKNMEHLLGAIPRRNLKDFITESKMPGVADYVRVANRMDGRRNELLSENEELAKRWNKYVSKNKRGGRVLGELMHASTMAAVDPSKKYAPLMDPKKMSILDKTIDAKRRDDWKLLNDWWNRMDEEAREIYKEVQRAYSVQRYNVEAALENRILASDADGKVKRALIDDLRAKFEAGRVGGPYFPLARFGELWAVAKDSAGDVVSFSRFEKVSEQREWMKSFREEGFEVDGGKKMEDMQVLNRIDPGFVAKITSMAEQLDVGLADEIWQLYLRAMPEMSMRKAFIHRKGRLGFTADAIRAFGHNMFHGAHQLSKLEYMHIMEARLEEMKDQARTLEKENDPEALWGAAVFKEMVRRHDWARNPSASILATKLTSLGFAWYLGLTPAAAAVNFTQTPIVGLPVLSSRFSWLGAARELTKAAALWAGSRGDVANRLRGDERAAMDEARRIGLFEKTQAHDLAGVSEEGVDYGSWQRQAMEYISWMFHKIEEANRKITFLAGYRLGRDEGLSHEDAILESEDLVWDSHFDYNNVNRPRYLQNDAAKVVLLFRQYSLNMTYRLSRDFNDALRDASPEARSRARQRFGGILMMTGLFGGLTSMPLMWAVTGILDAIFGDEDEPFDSETALRVYLADQYGPKVAEAIMKGGVDSLVGITMSTRVSLNNLWIREAPENLEGDDLWMHYVGELAGPIPSIPKDYFQAYQLFKEDQPWRAIEKMMPKAAKDTAKAYRFLSEGVQNMRGDDIIPVEEFQNIDAFYQALGFTPARLTMQYEQNRAVSRASNRIKRRRSLLMDQLFLAARNDDKQGIKEVVKKIARFNKVNPSVAIGASNIIASARSRQRYSMQSVGGVSLPPNMRHLHERLRFTPRRGEEK